MKDGGAVFDLTNRIILITGSTSGIGKAIALRTAEAGAQVIVTGRNVERGAEVVKLIQEAGGTAHFLQADISTADEARLLADAALKIAHGKIDVLVNNASIFPSAPTLEADMTTFDSIIDTNIRAPFFLTQAILPSMIEHEAGVVINMGSWVSQVGMATGALYSASKAMLEQLTRGWAAEFGPKGIRINAIAPGVIVTDGNSGASPMLQALADRLPARRLGAPDDIAYAAVYLASDEANYAHGTILIMDGGAITTR